MRGHGLQGIKCQTKEPGAGFQEHWGASEGLGAGEGQGREGRHEEDQGAASQPTGTGNWVRAAGHTEGLGPGGWGQGPGAGSGPRGSPGEHGMQRKEGLMVTSEDMA